jgi:hypothetical protein
MITIYENREIEGIEDFTKITSPDLFTQFVLHPRKFQEFIHLGGVFMELESRGCLRKDLHIPTFLCLTSDLKKSSELPD